MSRPVWTIRPRAGILFRYWVYRDDYVMWLCITRAGARRYIRQQIAGTDPEKWESFT